VTILGQGNPTGLDFLRRTLEEEIQSILQQYPDDGQIFKVLYVIIAKRALIFCNLVILPLTFELLKVLWNSLFTHAISNLQIKTFPKKSSTPWFSGKKKFWVLEFTLIKFPVRK